MKIKSYIAIVITLIISVIATGCGSTSNSTEEGGKEKDSRVVTTSVAVTEIVDALGVKMIGVPTSNYKLPEGTVDAKQVGNPMNPDLEIIKSLKPSVVISVDTLGKDYENMFIQNNIPSEFVSLTSLQGLKDSITNLGKLLNREKESEKILLDISEKEKSISERSSNHDKKDILIIFAAPGSMMLATEKSYIGDLVNIVGANNVVKDNKLPFATYSREEISKLNPDAILVMTHAKPEESEKMVRDKLEKDAEWKDMKAVKENRITYLDSQYFGMSANLKVMESLDKLCDIIYGNEVKNEGN
ncbi:iron complex transport system substrate-binding protein [Clostridium collagenovorans DSM 3089]|uniref:High-affinity heme uptake system protein IsdE n=1 Tax=Clostridium collagenovorans DSM 3089 TaxID=1121306 RepID=A0A1M5XWX1_9CLOT|nr:heme ABC transporter substrate-binding protein IsdE [Clostridium collagenovorans]SHI04331.1 iron complex transport system substrate-binding protein [Clostridium collagenovorans DSM 3089]